MFFASKHRRDDKRKVRIIRNERFREDGQLHTFGRSFGNRVAYAINRAAAKKVGSDLDCSRLEPFHAITRSMSR